MGGADIFDTVGKSFTDFNSQNADAIAAGKATPRATMPHALHHADTLALGSALALFMYRHSITGVLSTPCLLVIRRNASMLPAEPCSSGCSRCSASSRSRRAKVTNPQRPAPKLFQNELPRRRVTPRS